MGISVRRVVPERLDELAADDPRAIRSRRDLQRVHYAMATLSVLRRALARLTLPAQPLRILELGAGDGTLLLRLARALRHRWTDIDLTLLDRQDIVSAETREAYRELGWRVRVERAEVLTWTRECVAQPYDLCIAVLFLHHFEASSLAPLLQAIASKANAFVACEPRRSWPALTAGRLIGLIGGNEVTREDAVKSVAAGFAGLELRRMWPHAGNKWVMDEFPAPPFSHCFVAGLEKATVLDRARVR